MFVFNVNQTGGQSALLIFFFFNVMCSHLFLMPPPVKRLFTPLRYHNCSHFRRRIPSSSNEGSFTCFCRSGRQRREFISRD